MTRIFLLFVIAIFFNRNLIAQESLTNKVNTGPLGIREVSGIVKDSIGIPLDGVTVLLKSAKDSLLTTTNSSGIFIFKNVKSAVFFLTLSKLGYNSTTHHLLLNDASTKLVLDPIVLKSMNNVLEKVTIYGTPSITYKTDTIEYQASDYKVREHSRVDELLKKMEGMEVGKDGNLTHRGQPVTSARLNGKDFINGDVSATIQSLPADIVDKIQIVDDYGDQAARTGIKDGDPKKILNITTKADRSIGNIADIKGGAGNDDRYNVNLLGTRINANKTVAISGNFNNVINGIANIESSASTGQNNLAGGNSSPSSGGNTETANPAFSYRNTWGQKIEANLNYSYKYNTVNTLNASKWQQFNLGGTLFTETDNTNNINGHNHNLNLELDYSINDVNFLRIVPSLSILKNQSSAIDSNFQSGLIHQDQSALNNSKAIRPFAGGTVLYQHLFNNKRGRNFSIQLSSDNSNQQNDSEQNTNIIYYDGATNTVAKDSLVHRFIANQNLNSNYRGSFTFTEPLNEKSQIQFNGQVNSRNYDNSKITNNIFSGVRQPIGSLTNIYEYSFTESRFALNYRFSQIKYVFSLGVTAIPTLLKGNNISMNATTKRRTFNLIPIFRFQYQWSRQHQFQINYSGSPMEPTFSQLQPIRDISNPQRPVIGNPLLQNAFRNTISLTYSNYMANSRLNYSVNINSAFIQNQVVRDIQTIKDSYNSLKNEVHFANIDGNYSITGNYNLSKRLYNRKYSFSLNGTVNKIQYVSLSNSVKNKTSAWKINNRFAIRAEPTEWLEINPNISHNYIKSDNSLPTSLDSRMQTLSFNIDGRMYLPESTSIGYEMSKNYNRGIGNNVTDNPFVINAYAEKRVLRSKTTTIRLQVFDLLNQNNFINRTISETSIIDTKTNPLSRYFMISFTQTFQKWGGTPKRNGKPMQRRGDGSFID